MQDVLLGKQQLPDCVDNAVKNLTDKPTQSIGQTISDLWQLALGGPIAFAVEKKKLKYAHDLEVYRKSLEAKVMAIPEVKLIEPPLYIAAQALTDSQYCVEQPKLREMFTNLIANSMNADYSNILHPSFSKIIQQLSPLDAKMLELIYKWHATGGMAVVSYIRQASDDGYVTLYKNIPAESPQGCEPEFAARALVSLQRQGLIEIPDDLYFTDESRYDIFKKSKLYRNLCADAKSCGYVLGTEPHIATLTALGEDFVTVCLG